jgi:hypothetical protein
MLNTDTEQSICCDAGLMNGICMDCGEHSSPFVPICNICNDTGVVSKTEWTGTDTSYEVEKRCECQED